MNYYQQHLRQLRREWRTVLTTANLLLKRNNNTPEQVAELEEMRKAAMEYMARQKARMDKVRELLRNA